jgi:hypothetical protein
VVGFGTQTADKACMNGQRDTERRTEDMTYQQTYERAIARIAALHQEWVGVPSRTGAVEADGHVHAMVA